MRNCSRPLAVQCSTSYCRPWLPTVLNLQCRHCPVNAIKLKIGFIWRFIYQCTRATILLTHVCCVVEGGLLVGLLALDFGLLEDGAVCCLVLYGRRLAVDGVCEYYVFCEVFHYVRKSLLTQNKSNIYYILLTEKNAAKFV